MRKKTLIAVVFLFSVAAAFLSCRTTQSKSDLRAIDSTATDGKCLPPLTWYDQNPVKRLTTPELEKHLNERIGAKEWECDINSSLWAAVIGLEIPSGQTAKDIVAASGGLFGSIAKIPTPQGEISIPISDNKMQYNWSVEGSKGEFLPREKWYNHIIPQRKGPDQPELRRFLRNGDIIVYFYPSDRSTNLETFNQFRSGHSATIKEIKDSDNKTQFMLIDTPSSYARPIAGHDPSMFHVYRMMPRDSAGNGYPEAYADGYRDQVANWGAIALGRFPFQGDYDRLSFKAANQIDIYAKRYLASQFPAYDGTGVDLYPMYCAWYSFQNLSLGYMRPMNESGLATLSFNAPGAQVVPFFDRLMQGTDGYEFPMLNEGLGKNISFKEYFKAPDDLKPHSEMLFQPVTAPELLTNFLDRTIGPDVWVPEDQWINHASLKTGILEEGMQGFLAKFTTAPDPNLAASDTPDASEYDNYNQKLEQMFKNIVTLYKESIVLQGDPLKTKRKEITEKTYALIVNERAKSTIPKKWLPPYAYTREAEAYETFYRPETSSGPYRPRMVYVGTVVPEVFLKEPGAAETVFLPAIRATEETPEDRNIKEAVGKILANTGAGHPQWKLTVDAFLMELHKQCIGKDQSTCDGLNEFEMAAIIAARAHWRPDIDHTADNVAAQIASHNSYGLDDVLVLRALVSYWNNPTDFRAAIYEGDASTLASIALNLRIIFSVAPTEVKAEADRVKSSSLTNGHPRRISPIKCRNDDATTISQANQKCAPVTSYFY